MKRFVLLLIALLTISGAVAAQEATPEVTTKEVSYIILTGTTNVREEPSEASDVISQPIGVSEIEAEITDEKGRTWYQILAHYKIPDMEAGYSFKTGYVASWVVDKQTGQSQHDCEFRQVVLFQEPDLFALLYISEQSGMLYAWASWQGQWQELPSTPLTTELSTALEEYKSHAFLNDEAVASVGAGVLRVYGLGFQQAFPPETIACLDN